MRTVPATFLREIVAHSLIASTRSFRKRSLGRPAGDAIVVPGRLLSDLVRLLPDESVSLRYDEGEGVLERPRTTIPRAAATLSRGQVTRSSEAVDRRRGRCGAWQRSCDEDRLVAKTGVVRAEDP